MKRLDKSHTKTPVICLRTGARGWALLDDEQMASRKPVLHPKTNLDAAPMTMGGLVAAVPRLIERLVELENRIFELECEAQERAEPGVNTAD